MNSNDLRFIPEPILKLNQRIFFDEKTGMIFLFDLFIDRILDVQSDRKWIELRSTNILWNPFITPKSNICIGEFNQNRFLISPSIQYFSLLHLHKMWNQFKVLKQAYQQSLPCDSKQLFIKAKSKCILSVLAVEYFRKNPSLHTIPQKNIL